MISPRISLSEAANNLWEAICRHEGDYSLVIDKLGRLDLIDYRTGDREPIAMIEVEDR